jgi:hypothetical protein
MQWRLILCCVLTGGLAVVAQEAPVSALEAQEVTSPTPAPKVEAANASTPARAGSTETVQQALCRLIDASARQHGLPVEFFTRLIWQESSFRTGVVSPAGAQGVAQFMPGTAAERGLLNPFDPEQAIPKSAKLLRDHVSQFGNIGLAAAAYNGGPGRVANWLADKGGLPEETRTYVSRITGRSAQFWAEERRARERPAPAAEEGRANEEAKGSGQKLSGTSPSQLTASCLQVTAMLLQRPDRNDPIAITAAAIATPSATATTPARAALPSLPAPRPAPWGVQLAGNFSKDLALASYSRVSRSYAGVLGAVRPIVVGTRLRSRGTRTFYQVRVPAETRTAADQLCNRIRTAGGACIVLPS